MQNGVIMNTKMKSFGFVLALTAFAMAQEAAPVAEAADTLGITVDTCIITHDVTKSFYKS